MYLQNIDIDEQCNLQLDTLDGCFSLYFLALSACLYCQDPKKPLVGFPTGLKTTATSKQSFP